MQSRSEASIFHDTPNPLPFLLPVYYHPNPFQEIISTTFALELTYALETLTLTKRDRKQLNVFERKVYRRFLGPVYGNEKENWRILTNEEIYANIKKP